MAGNRPHARRAAAQRQAARDRRQRLVRIGVPLGAVALAVGVAVIASDQDPSEPQPLTAAEQIATGAGLFAENCATCHGAELQGTFAGPPLVDEIYRPDHHPDAAIRTAIANGVRPHHWDFAGMPPIAGLSDQDVDALIAFIRDTQDAAWAGEE